MTLWLQEGEAEAVCVVFIVINMQKNNTCSLNYCCWVGSVTLWAKALEILSSLLWYQFWASANLWCDRDLMCLSGWWCSWPFIKAQHLMGRKSVLMQEGLYLNLRSPEAWRSELWRHLWYDGGPYSQWGTLKNASEEYLLTVSHMKIFDKCKWITVWRCNVWVDLQQLWIGKHRFNI